MLTVPPANDSLDAVPPTDERASTSERAQAGFGQVGGAHQTVVTGADDHGVVVGSGHRFILADGTWG